VSRRRVVLDSNVLISAILFGGSPGRVLDLVITGAVRCGISPPILDEVREVLQRSKFGFTAEQALVIVEELHGLCQLVEPTLRVRAVLSDPDDDMVLECAQAAKADTIVSGDRDLLNLVCYQGIRILSPAAYLAELHE
jgi:putative PIN family toxin of toxin-antitoxin system